MKKTIFFFIVAVIFTSACSTQKQGGVELVIDSQSDLGEGAIWNYKSGELMWIDITGKILNFYTPRTGNNKEMFTGQMIGTVVPAESGMVLVALQNGIYTLHPETGTKSLVVDPEENIPTNRFNDGKCDPSGRFWAAITSGTVDIPTMSPPKIRNILYSAGVSKVGPEVPT